MLRLTYDFVRQQFLNGGCVLLSTDYKNNHEKLDYVCSCGNKSIISLNSFKQGGRCKRCAGVKKSNAHIGKSTPEANAATRLSYDYVKKVFLDAGCILLSSEYKSNRQKLDYICNCGRISKIRLFSFKEGQRCKHCGVEKNRIASTGRVVTEETRLRISKAEKGKIISEETTRKQQETIKRQFASGERIIWNKNLTKENDERVKKNTERAGETLKRRYAEGELIPYWQNKSRSEETKQILSKFFSSPTEKQKKRLARLKQVFPVKDTRIEIALQQKLSELGIQFEKHKSIMGQPDIFIYPNICIFADGCYWHDCNQCFDGIKLPSWIIAARVRDNSVNLKLKEQGYVVVRFWEHEIKNNLDFCVKTIIDEISKRGNIIG